MTRCALLLLALTVLAGPARAQTDTAPEITAETHDAVMEDMLGAPTHEIREIGILVYDGVNDLDLMGPRYVLGQIMGARTRLVSTIPGTVRTVMGVEIVPDVTVAEVDSLDILVVPGGFEGTVRAVYDDTLHDWIRAVDQTTTYTTAVCTGSWVLAATGLLEGRRATTNWYRAEEMLARHGATFSHERWTQDGKYWTSAGVTAGMDMSLAIVQDLFGDAYVQGVMLDMEYDPAPPVVGGTPETTSPEVVQMMQAMYDMGIQPLMDELEAERAAANSASESR